MLKGPYTDLKIYRDYLWGAVKTRQVLFGFDVIQHLKSHYPEDTVKTFLIYHESSRQILLTENFDEPEPIWKPEKIRTQVKLVDRFRFYLPEFLDSLLLAVGARDHRAEVDQTFSIIGETMRAYEKEGASNA